MTLRSALAILFCSAAAACVPRAPQPTPPPVSRPAPAPTPTPTPAPPPVAWMDAPQTPGDWTYRKIANGSLASFGGSAAAPLLWLRCDAAARTLAIARPGGAGAAVPMRILTETRERLLDAPPSGDPTPGVAASVPASDMLLDAMAFSKGRFAVETAGMATLYVPAWPEVTRVIEDCR